MKAQLCSEAALGVWLYKVPRVAHSVSQIRWSIEKRASDRIMEI